jgi:hypothetical protein
MRSKLEPTRRVCAQLDTVGAAPVPLFSLLETTRCTELST